MPKITLEKLALMVANAFEEISEKVATKEDINRLEAKFESEIDRLDIRLDQMAPNFEVKDLKKRVTKIERHLGLT